MIAVSSSGRSFGALATYLAAGRSGEERDRVAWATARNLPTSDPELAGRFMRATAAQSDRVEKPVYHLVLSFDPHDSVGRSSMERVAVRVLERLGLDEHEAVIVAHRDREHPHMHVLVNRIHPATGKAWERWQDQPLIQRVLREEERALGVREVPGKLYGLPEHEARREAVLERGMKPDRDDRTAPGRPERGRVRAGDRTVEIATGEPESRENGRGREIGARPGEPSGELSLVECVQRHVPALRASSSWGEMEAYLALHGLRLERKGQGLVFTDGEAQVKASRVARDLSMTRLEERFEASYDAHIVERMRAIARAEAVMGDDLARFDPVRDVGASAGDATRRGSAGLAPDLLVASAERLPQGDVERGGSDGQPADRVQAIACQLESCEQVAAHFGEHYAATQALSAARAKLSQLEASEARVRVADERFDQTLAAVYREPAQARQAFDRAAVERGIEAAARELREHPERFGALQTVEQRRALGLVRTADDSLARRAALSAATLSREAWAARAGLPAPVERSAIREAVPKAAEREREAREALGRRPEKGMLEHEVGRAMRQLLPREVEALRRWVTNPRFALAMRLKEAVREAVLGPKEQER